MNQLLISNLASAVSSDPEIIKAGVENAFLAAEIVSTSWCFVVAVNDVLWLVPALAAYGNNQ